MAPQIRNFSTLKNLPTSKLCPNSKRVTPNSPWLVLPPVLSEGGDMVYNFYSLADDRTLTFDQQGRRGGGGDFDQTPRHYPNLLGSSHGWLAFWGNNHKSLFLSNPISGRHIKLPPPPPPRLWLERLLLSRSPDEDGCFAAHVGGGSGAFCAPGVGTAWTPIKLESHEKKDISYQDFAYCSRRGVFSSITEHTHFKFDLDCVGVEELYYRNPHHQIDDWNVLDGERVETTWFWKYKGSPHPWKDTKHCYQKLRLVYADDHFDLPLVIVRFATKSPPYKTAGFVVVQIEKHGNGCRKGCIKVVEDLKGLAIFVGENQTFAIPAAEAEGIVKPNSIYFACGENEGFRKEKSFDVGIFDYQERTITPLCDDKYCHFVEGTRAKEVMWFTPNP